MPDIGIYTTDKVLEHKQRDGKQSDGMECYWELSKIPDVKVGERLWVACKGFWQGFFIIHRIDSGANGADIDFYSESWHPANLDDLAMSQEMLMRKPFQGFTYNVPKAEVAKT